ncbi:MAG: UDP-3-O-acyl-N-acetylglucosamine deacetylase [Planctomycetota bacterium]|nr:UDP-3-O-acyl-N-acetylglucosamine deacetylase [Planctomycetota bacterium]
MPRKQRTIRREKELRGIGLHEGVEATLKVRPAAADTGVTFVRTDLPSRPRVPADAAHLAERSRRTALVGAEDAEVHTVEHFLACCTALGIDNLEVELSGPECPGMDGSARPFLDLLQSAEPVELDAERKVVAPKEPVSVRAGSATLVAFPSQGGLSVSYTLDYGSSYPGTQHLSLHVDPETFGEELAGARTFCLEAEAEQLRQAGLGKGATYENTLVIGADGVIENELRWPDEFARHKAMDLLGDLFMLGADLEAHVVAHRSGHAANLQLVGELRKGAEAPARGRRGKADDGPPEPALNHAQIRRILPHRYPFLLVDRVTEIDGFQRAVGIKNVSVNEPFFEGHYPDQPIMPGVLIIEAMAQLAGLLLLRKLELTGKVPVLLSIDRVKFRRAVVPGDQIRMEAFTLRLSAGRGRVRCRSTVDGQLVSEARLNFAMTEPPS